jgi:hypothetical protein
VAEQVYMRRIKAPLLLVAILVAVSACHLWSPKSDLESEAEKIATQYWASCIPDCNGSQLAYMPGSGGSVSVLPSDRATLPIRILEFKNPRTWIHELNVTAADRLNGIEWEGSTGVDCSASRAITKPKNEMDKPTGWTAWSEPASDPRNVHCMAMHVSKIKGTWKIYDDSVPPYDKKVDCSLLPPHSSFLILPPSS